MRSSRSLALLLCLAGAALLLAGASGQWASARITGLAPLPDRDVVVRGADLVGGLRALGVVALAGVPALLAARRRGRQAVGVLLLAAGVAAVALTGRVLADLSERVYVSDAWSDSAGPLPPGDGFVLLAAPTSVDGTAWPYAVLVAGLLVAVAGLLAVVRGASWEALGARYEPPAAAGTAPAPAPEGDKHTWEALDRGEDPTR